MGLGVWGFRGLAGPFRAPLRVPRSVGLDPRPQGFVWGSQGFREGFLWSLKGVCRNKKALLKGPLSDPFIWYRFLRSL